MSRGLGATQREILDILNEAQEARRVDWVCREVYGVDHPTRSQLVATRRAVHQLKERGLVGCGEYPGNSGRNAQDSYLYAWPESCPPKNAPDERLSRGEFIEWIIEYLSAKPQGSPRYDMSRWINRRLSETGRRWPSISGAGTRMVSRCLAELEQQGIVVVYRTGALANPHWTVRLSQKMLSVAMSTSLTDTATLSSDGNQAEP